MTARKCEGCGRALRKSPGPYGPVCARRLTGTPQSPSPARSAPQAPRVPPTLSRALTATHAAPLHPGQIELPLEDQ